MSLEPRTRRKLIAVLLACLLVPVSAIAWTMHAAAARTDEVAAAHEERLAANAWEIHKRVMARTVMTETVWDDAVRNLDLGFDPAWAETNMIAFFTETSGYELVIVIDNDGKVLLSHLSGGDARRVWPALQGELSSVVASIRAREATIQRRPGPSKVLVSDPVDASTLVRIGDQPFMITAALVQPDFGHATPSAHAPVVIVGQAVDADFLKSFASANLMRDVRLVRTGAKPTAGRSILPLRDFEGRGVARLSWSPEAPGAGLVRSLGFPLAALIAALVLIPIGLYFWERWRSKQLQLARDAAEAASIAKSQFLANMSHEIRTPLNGVLGVAGALVKTELTPAQHEMVELVCNSASSLQALLSDILDLARVESGALEIRREPFDLASSLSACTSLFDAAATAKGLDLQVTVAPEAQGSYLGDAARIRQVLSNLLSNAVKFTAEGAIAVHVGATGDADQPELQFEVRDSGIGFDDETAARLFSRFEQGDGSITRRYGGSGLGLAISRTLARAMGGDLAATSEPGIGSTFALRLPLTRCAPVAASKPLTPSAAVGAQGLRVLLAEDHPTNRRVVELILEAVDVDLTSVCDGAQAVSAFETQAFDLVLMDMQMPVMDGLSAIRLIRQAEAALGAPRTPIYVLTANAMPDHIAASAAAGADGHLTKPITPDLLLDVVARVAEAAPDKIEPAQRAAS